MKTTKTTLLLVTMGLVTLAACGPKGPDPLADEAALKADPTAWFEAFNAGNADGVANLYAEDALLLGPAAPAVAGRAAIRDFIAADIEKMKGAGLTYASSEITGVGVSGDLGWLSGTVSVANASGATVDTAKFVSVYRRISGDWQLIRDIWNSDMAPAAAAPTTPAVPAEVATPGAPAAG